MDKKELWFGIIGSIILIGLTVFFAGKYQQKIAQLNSVKVATPVVSGQPNSTLVTLTVQEVAKHNSASDCWMIVNNLVYEVTKYANLHPGGSENIINYCGKDATDAFNSIKDGRGHSSQADQQHTFLKIGNLGETVGHNVVNNATQNATKSGVFDTREREED